MDILKCFSFLKCLGDSNKPVIEFDDSCNCCRRNIKYYKVAKSNTWAYLRKYSNH